MSDGNCWNNVIKLIFCKYTIDKKNFLREMEKDDPDKKSWILDWIGTAKPDALKYLEDQIEKHKICMNYEKLNHLQLDWKNKLSDDPETFKYREPETNMYYETRNILEYIQDCRQRKNVLSDQDIMDYELVHKDVSQKLFFWINKRFEDDIEAFSSALKKFLLRKTGKIAEISIDEFGDKLIVICTNIVVDNYLQKKHLLTDFGSYYRTDEIGGYIARVIDTYEEIPSIANAAYKNAETMALVGRGYLPNKALAEQLMKIIPRHDLSGGMTVVFINNVNITNIHQATDTPFKQFVDHILQDQPDWYIPDTWLPKSTLADKFEEHSHLKTRISDLVRHLKSEGLFDKIAAGEKRARYGDAKKLISLFLTQK